MTTKEPSLGDLASRCEQATGPDRELDKAIFQALPFGVGGSFPGIPEFTTYLDAALTLVPEGWNWRAGFGGEAGWAAVYPGVVPNWRSDPIAATPALALCAAALRARANTPKHNKKDGG